MSKLPRSEFERRNARAMKQVGDDLEKHINKAGVATMERFLAKYGYTREWAAKTQMEFRKRWTKYFK